MSLYNALFGVNKIAPLLLKMLDIDQPNNKYPSGRFRDIYFSEDGKRIVLYTRNGGGNREQYQETIDKLATHPNYIKDYDDDFDCTFAYIEFSIPKEFESECADLAKSEPPRNPSKAWDQLLKDMESGKTTEATQRAEQVGRKIFGAIEKGEQIITVDPKDGELLKEN